MIDATYRTDLRELNESNYVRFEAKLEQRIGELRADLGLRISAIEHKVEHLVTREEFERGLREQTRFMFLAWAVLLASNIALWFR